MQFGLRPIHSTNHALISITEQIKTSLDIKINLQVEFS